jgi:hypothetical protein
MAQGAADRAPRGNFIVYIARPQRVHPVLAVFTGFTGALAQRTDNKELTSSRTWA